MAKNDSLRELILECVRASETSVSKDVIHKHVLHWIPDASQLAISQTTTWMVRNGVLDKTSNGYRMHQEGQEHPAAIQRNPITEAPKPIAPFFAAGKGKTVIVQTSPIQYDDVFRVFFERKGYRSPVLMNPEGMRIDLGPQIPDWSPEQITVHDVNALIFQFKDGSQQEFPTNPNHPITFDRPE